MENIKFGSRIRSDFQNQNCIELFFKIIGPRIGSIVRFIFGTTIEICVFGRKKTLFFFKRNLTPFRTKQAFLTYADISVQEEAGWKTIRWQKSPLWEAWWNMRKVPLWKHQWWKAKKQLKMWVWNWLSYFQQDLACYFVASAKAWLSFHSSSSPSSSSFQMCTSVLPKDPRPSRFCSWCFPQNFQLKWEERWRALY